MSLPSQSRRQFLVHSALGLGGLSGMPGLMGAEPARPGYEGPRVVLIRFGGGARRRETLDPNHTFTPFLRHELVKRGVLYPRMEIDQFRDLQTSHGEGTLHLLTGVFDRYRDVAETRAEVGHRFLGARFEARVPTLFEYLREAYDVPDHQVLLVNGEDRGDEEFYNFSNHHLFGVRYRSQTLSLRRYKTWLLREQLAAHRWDGAERGKKEEELRGMQSLDYRVDRETGQGTEIEAYWARWRAFYGESGRVNPRGDRLLTELALRALRDLRPRLMMINYQDCDYVHWGYLDHYTRALAIMDAEIQKLVAGVEADPEYRDNTVFVVVPDCGRDDNPYNAVPCQHHFNSRSAHEIFALVFGAGIARGQVVDRKVSQIQVAATIGRLMKMPTPHAEGRLLEEVFA